jgi:uncharacterized protein YbjT (DUF2867 family)
MGTTLVIGATGKVGREVVAQLVARGEHVRAATRNPAAANLPKNASAVQFRLDREEDLRNALAGADRLFMLAPENYLEPDRAVARIVEKGKAAGIGTMVLMTAMGVEYSDNPFSRAERIVSESGLRHTFIRPNWFMQNFSIGSLAKSIRHTGHICLPAADARVSFVDTRDIGAVAAASLTEGTHAGKGYTVTGGRAMTHTEVAEIISKVSGKPVTYTSISDDELRARLSESGMPESALEAYVTLFQPMREGAYEAVSADVSTVLDRPPIAFEQHAQDFADCWRG